ncbi:MAG: hypothetical protein U9O94_11195 [Nanoarchaeota archaeon]|nr:hypothetical protein [Nanoarchaeota archaeon]
MVDFKWNVKNSFKKVKADFDSLKESTNEWVVFLDNKNNDAEKRLEKMEDKIERLEETLFKVLSER